MSDSERGNGLPNLTKIINYRPILFVAVSFAVGVFFFGKFCLNGYTATLAAAAIVIGVSLLFLPFSLGKSIMKYAVTTLLCVLFCLFGYFYSSLRLGSFDKGKVKTGDYIVKGTVSTVSTYNGVKYAVLTDCVYDGRKGGNLYVIGYGENLSKFDEVKGKFAVEPAYSLSESGVSRSVIYDRANKTTKIYSLNVTGREKSLPSFFAKSTDEILSDGLSGDSFGIAVGLLRGDTSYMNGEIDGYRLSGIAHVFAVSGMHVGLVFAAASFIVGLFKVKRNVRPFIIAPLLFLYAYLCGNSPSAIRAAVMCSVAAAVRGFGEKSDRINGISVALFIVLVINPFDLFTAGLVLSFSVSFAIIILAPPLKRLFARFMPDKFSDSFAVIIAAQTVAMPLSVGYFGSFPLVAIITNLMLLPFISVAFFSLWSAVLLCLIFPFNRLIALYIPNFIIKATSVSCEILAGFPLSLAKFGMIFGVVYYFALFICSDMVNARPIFKKISALIAAISALLAAFVPV